MRTVEVKPPSFPDVIFDASIRSKDETVWQVLCGDANHWRAGIYSPKSTTAGECGELERHNCPELFLLLRGRLSLVLFEKGSVRTLVLEPGRPVLVRAPHNGFCPDGPHTGSAFVVERDIFQTEYKTAGEWAEGS
jgi:hypothetical protein